MEKLDKHPAVKELKEIVRLRSELERHVRIVKWVEAWISEAKGKQLVISKESLTSEYHDAICDHVVKQCLDEIIEDKLVKFDIKDRVYSSSIMVLRNEKK